MHLCGNRNNISRVRRLVRIALLLTFARHWNTSSGVTWMTRHSFCTAQKKINLWRASYHGWFRSVYHVWCLFIQFYGSGLDPDLRTSPDVSTLSDPAIHIITVMATASGRALVEKNSNRWPFLVPSTHPNTESLSFKSGPETRPSGPWNQSVVLRTGLCKTSEWRHDDSVKSSTVNSLNTEPPTDGKRQGSFSCMSNLVSNNGATLPEASKSSPPAQRLVLDRNAKNQTHHSQVKLYYQLNWSGADISPPV